MSPLDRALALAEVDHVSVLIAEDLYLDVARVFYIFLDIDGRVIEGELGFILGRRQGREKLIAVAHGVGHMPVEIPVPYPSLGLRGARGFELEENMVISLDCLYFGAELGPCHMENVFIINAGGAESTYATPLEIMGPR